MSQQQYQPAAGRESGGRQFGGQRVGGQPMGQQFGGQQPAGGQQTGQQFGGGQQVGPQVGGERGVTFGEVLTGPMRVALMDFVRAAEVCEWCADQCIAEARSEMVECARLCRDVADVATLNAKLLSRQSPFGTAIAEDFVEAAEACAAECATHADAHCQECARVLRRAVRSTRDLLESVGQARPQQGQPTTA